MSRRFRSICAAAGLAALSTGAFVGANSMQHHIQNSGYTATESGIVVAKPYTTQTISHSTALNYQIGSEVLGGVFIVSSIGSLLALGNACRKETPNTYTRNTTYSCTKAERNLGVRL